MPPASGKILVVRGGAIGDFILTAPVLSALRTTFPETDLELLTYPRVGPLALAAGLAHRVHPIDARPMASFFAKGGRLPADLADYFKGFAIILSYLFDPDRIFQENVLRCSKAQFIVGPHRPDERAELHASDAFLQPLVRLAIFDADPVPRLTLNGHGSDREDLVLPGPTRQVSTVSSPRSTDDWLAVHPGSGSERKNWPEPLWKELLTRLNRETQLRVLLVGGEAEGERLTRLAAALPKERLRMAQSLPLTDLAVLLQQCQGYLGHDSGISHLAAALQLRGLVLWGSTNAEVWRPRSDRMRLLSAPDGLAELSVDEVFSNLREQLERSELET